MNSSLVCIGILVKSDIGKLCLINFLNDVSSLGLGAYLGFAGVSDGNATQKKSGLIEIIIYGCMNGKLKNRVVDEISTKRTYTILRESNISIKSLPGYGKMSLRKKDIKPYVENKSSG